MATLPPAGAPPHATRAPWAGLAAAVLLVAASIALPVLLGWNVETRRDDRTEFPPLHGFWDPKLVPLSALAVAVALLGWRYAERFAERLAWRPLLLVCFALGAAWLVSLALVDGGSGLTRVLGNPYEYLRTARDVDDVGLVLETYVERMPYGLEDAWVTHVAGHPPLALLFFVGLVRIGLGGDLAAALVVTGIAATTAPAVMVTLRALGAERVARRAAPFLVLTPAAVFMAVSADAMFAAVAAWGLAALALAATAAGRARLVTWSVVAGLLLGACVLLSYGLPLLGLLALAVLTAARCWWPLPVAAAAALALVLGFAAAGFVWWEAYPVLVERYYDGVASDRPQWYWAWGNLGALLISAGPLIGAGVGTLAATARRTPRAPALLVGAALATVLVATLSGMSRSEVERIWLPFIPWLTVSLALLPDAWRRWGLALQVGFALVVQHLLYTSW